MVEVEALRHGFGGRGVLDSLSVFDDARLARRLAGLPEDRLRCREVLEDLGVAALARARPSTLPHGQAQRVALARAVVDRPAVILAEEPTSSLDDEGCERAASLTESQAAGYGAVLVVATHASRLLGRFADRLSLTPCSPTERRGRTGIRKRL